MTIAGVRLGHMPIFTHDFSCQRGVMIDAASDCYACRLEAKLAEAAKGQKHYPCLCHDWVFRDGEWELVRRPT